MPIRESFSVMSSPHVIPNPQKTATTEFFKDVDSLTNVFFSALVQCSLGPHGLCSRRMCIVYSGCTWLIHFSIHIFLSIRISSTFCQESLGISSSLNVDSFGIQVSFS